MNTARRADILLVVLNLADAPLAQMETVHAHLVRMKVSIIESNSEDETDIILTLKKALIVGNMLDMASARKNYQALEERYGNQINVTAISASTGQGLEELKLKIYETLDIIRVYTKTPGKKPDLTDPIVLKRGSTLEDAATNVHKDFAARLKYARIWGSGKHDGVMAKRDHVLKDGDIIELHL